MLKYATVLCAHCLPYSKQCGPECHVLLAKEQGTSLRSEQEQEEHVLIATEVSGVFAIVEEQELVLNQLQY